MGFLMKDLFKHPFVERFQSCWNLFKKKSLRLSFPYLSQLLTGQSHPKKGSFRFFSQGLPNEVLHLAGVLLQTCQLFDFVVNEIIDSPSDMRWI